MSLKDKVVLVTGASSGIGAAIALQGASDSADIVMVGRNEAKLRNVADKCQNKNGRKPLVIIADVSKDDDVKRIVDTTINTYKKLDVLVNNAGFGVYSAILNDNALEAYDSLMATNVRGVISLTHFAIPHLIKTKGNIVNVSSAVVQKPFSTLWAYGVSKAALDHFSTCAAAEFAPKGVRVNIVSPGPVRSDFFENMGLDKELLKTREERTKPLTALGRISDAEEIADLVLFLASDKAKGITGSRYVTDNGYLLK